MLHARSMSPTYQGSAELILGPGLSGHINQLARSFVELDEALGWTINLVKQYGIAVQSALLNKLEAS